MCLTGIDKAARDMTQMQRSSQQIERALERVKIIQRGAGTLVRPPCSRIPLPGVSMHCNCASQGNMLVAHDFWQPMVVWLRARDAAIARTFGIHAEGCHVVESSLNGYSGDESFCVGLGESAEQLQSEACGVPAWDHHASTVHLGGDVG